jgi:glycosyltransferase involved in cell wall biosynthesis
MKISIIIPTYNYGKYLSDAINSALNQSFNKQDYEIIIVYRESSDSTDKILERYSKLSNIKIIEQFGKGLVNACNIGIERSAGEYLIRLDADDIFYKDILLIESLLLDKNPDCGFVYPDYIYFWEEKRRQIRKYLPPFNEEELAGRGEFLGGGTMFRRSLFDQLGNYDETIVILHDYEFMLRLLSKGVKGYQLKIPLFKYRIHDDSLSKDTDLLYEVGQNIAARYGRKYQIGEHHPRRIED